MECASYDRTYPLGSILEIAQSTDLLSSGLFFVSHISYFVLRVFFFVMEGMEVSDAAVDTVAIHTRNMI